MADSDHTSESDFLKNLRLKTSIAWGNSIDERWTQLYNKVSIKLHMCTTLAETVSHLQETIYTEAASIFGHLQQKTRCLAGQSRRTKLSIQLIHSTYPPEKPAFSSNQVIFFTRPTSSSYTFTH